MSSVKNSKQGSCENSVTPEGYLHLPRFMFMGPSPDETILSGVDKILSALKKNCIQMREENGELSEIYSRKSSLTYSSGTVESRKTNSDVSQPSTETSAGTGNTNVPPMQSAPIQPQPQDKPVVVRPKEGRGDEIKPYTPLKSSLKPPAAQCTSRDAEIEKKICEVFKIVRNPYARPSVCPPKRVKTKSILTKLHVYDDTSKIVEIMKPKPANKYKPRKEEYESIFVVLPNGASVGFLVLAKLKTSKKVSYYHLK